jgi:hypothetical protein
LLNNPAPRYSAFVLTLKLKATFVLTLKLKATIVIPRYARDFRKT